MAKPQFVSDEGRVVLMKPATGDQIAETANRLLEVVSTDADSASLSGKGGLPTDETLAAFSLLEESDIAKTLATVLNTVLRLGADDISASARALEILVDQLLADTKRTNPEHLLTESMHYVFKQEGWNLDVRAEPREDGTRFCVVNPNGPDLPHAIFLSKRGKTPAYWIMEDKRIIQGTHAYKIPIQAAQALKQALSDYLSLRDVGGMVARA